MADPLSIIASAITVGATAAHLSLALFNIAHTFKSAPEEIADIADELSTVSQSLIVLGECLKRAEIQNLCRQELFTQLSSVVSRYRRMEEQLKKIIGARTKFRRIKWFFDSPRAKGLLKKIEGVKTSLTLILSILRLAYDEVSRLNDANEVNRSNQQASQFHPNRYRKLAESNVEAHRLAVERAEKEAAAERSIKRPHFDRELQRYQLDIEDTAPWLYQLVFTATAPTPTSATNAIGIEGARSATVEDYDSDSTEEIIHEPVSSPHTGASSKSTELIVWNAATEPSSVVDRLLRSWTTLDVQYIETSKSSQNLGDEAWEDTLVKRIKEYVDQKSTSQSRESVGATSEDSDDAETISLPSRQHSSDEEEYKSAEEQSTAHSLENNVPPQPAEPIQERYAGSSEDEWRYQPEAPRFFYNNRAKGVQKPREGKNRKKQSDKQRDASFGPRTSKERKPKPSDTYAGGIPPPQETPFYSHAPHSMQHPGNPAFFTPSAWPPPVPRNSGTTHPYYDPEPTVNSRNKDRSQESATATSQQERLDRLEELIKRLSDVRESAPEPSVKRAVFETHDNEDRFAKLENLLLEQREDDLRRQAAQEMAWRAEKAEASARLAEDALKARKLAEKEIKEAKAAKKAAEKALNFAKDQAAKRARDEAEAKAMEERRKLDTDYATRIRDYELKLATFASALTKPEEPENHGSTSMPLRTTSIFQGDRKIEISEFTRDRLGPLIETDLLAPKHGGDYVPEGRQTLFGQLHVESQPARSRTYSTSMSAPRLLGSQADPNSSASDSSQKVVVLSSRLDRGSTRVTAMQDSLDECGVATIFGDPSVDNRALVRRDPLSQGEVVRSTIFWEPPWLSLGSEVLSTMRSVGWRPFYFRRAEAGQTYFLGDQPIHVNFFRPNYQPQFTASQYFSDSECIVIAKDLVEEYALLELGFDFKSTSSAAYALDCRLTAADVEALIERSFMIRETHYRREHRLLHWKEPYPDPPGLTPASHTLFPNSQPTTPSTRVRSPSSADFRSTIPTSTDHGSQRSTGSNADLDESIWEPFEDDRTQSSTPKVIDDIPNQPAGTRLRLRTAKSKKHCD